MPARQFCLIIILQLAGDFIEFILLKDIVFGEIVMTFIGPLRTRGPNTCPNPGLQFHLPKLFSPQRGKRPGIFTEGGGAAELSHVYYFGNTWEVAFYKKHGIHGWTQFISVSKFGTTFDDITRIYVFLSKKILT